MFNALKETQMSADMTQVQAVLIEAQVHAANATRAFLAVNGDRDACGFAWVTVYKVRSNSKLGKELAKVGFSKAYGGGLQLWNPAATTPSASLQKKWAPKPTLAS